MDQAPLVMDEIEAGNGLLGRLNTFDHVVAACWLRNCIGRRATRVQICRNGKNMGIFSIGPLARTVFRTAAEQARGPARLLAG